MDGGSTPPSVGHAPHVARTMSADKKRPVHYSHYNAATPPAFALLQGWSGPMVAPMTVAPYAYAANQGLVNYANKHARILAACPILELHRPLAAAAACHAKLPPAHAGQAEVWSAVAKYLSQLRASFLMGHPPPQTPGYSFSPAMLRSALLEDVLAGDEGLLGRERQAVNGGANEGTGDGASRSGKSDRGVRPYADSLPRCPDAYVGFFRRGTFARCIKRALEGPAHALTAPVGRNVHTGGSAAVDFGLQRWVAGEDAARMDPTPAPSPHAALPPHALAPNPFKRRAAARATSAAPAGDERRTLTNSTKMPLERWRTRHVEVTNDGDVAVLLLAATAAPAQDAFRLRCDHEGLVRHPADDGSPIDDQPPVVLHPGATYELSVDLRCDEASARVGSLSQWILVAFVEMPEGWNNKRGLGSGSDRRNSSRDGDEPDGFDLMFDEKDVRVIGKRVGALVTGSRARTAELGALLDVDTPKFVPKRLREAFDSLPLLTVAPVTLIDDDADEKHMAEVGATLGENENDPTWVAIWERSQRNKATIEMRSRTSNRMAPAAYRGPRGVFLQRAFHCSNPWGEENGEQMYMHDMEWERVESSIESRPMKRELARWIRLVRLEEAQQALDIRRYDAHDAVLKYAGSTRTVKARSVSMGVANGRNTMDMTNHMPFDKFGRYDVDVYSLEVPGLIEGYPPVARNDVLRLRIVSVGTGREDENDSLPFDANVTEVAATVVRVLTRKSTVYVAVPPLVTRVVFDSVGSKVVKGESLRREIRAHVRFAYDEALFRSQRAALEAASANELVSDMLREVPEALQPGVEDPLIGRKSGYPGYPTTPMAMLDALNPEQRKVVTDVLDGTAAAVASRGARIGPPYCVLGPPGTGKTLTVVSAAAAVLESDPNARILLCAPAAFAADVLCSRLAELVPLLSRRAPLPEMVRREIYELRTQFKEKGKFWDPGFRLKHHQAALEAHFSRTMVRVNDPRRDAASVKKDVEQFCVPPESIAAFYARVVVCSCASASLLHADQTPLYSRRFTHIFIDEAGQATVPESLVPLRLVTLNCKAVVLAGDPMQLGPVVHSGVAARGSADGILRSGLMTSLLEQAAAHHAHPQARATVQARCMRLVRNYRSHKDIIDLPSKLFYRNSLVACVDDSAVALPASLAQDDEEEAPAEEEEAPAPAAATYAAATYATAADANGAVKPWAWVQPPDPALRSKIFELRVLFPDHGDGYLAACALHYGDVNGAASHLLEDDLPPHIASMPTSTPWPPPNCGVDQPSGQLAVKRTTATTTPDAPAKNSKPPPRLARVLFYGVRGRQAREGSGEAPSFFNAVEAQELVNLVETWLSRGGGGSNDDDADDDGLKVSDVGVVAPYRSQVIRVRNLLRARNLGAVRVGTVDDYQGQEEKVMFISTVVSRAPSKHVAAAAKAAAGGSAGEASVAGLALGFLACPRRFNVAISRARALNVVVGHPVALTHWPHWHSLLQHCYSRGAFLGSGSEFIPRLGGGRENVDPALDSVVGDVEPDDEADFEELKRAVDRMAEMSLLGGGDDMWPDDGDMMASAFQEDREWRVAL